MKTAFLIFDRFKIKERGEVYVGRVIPRGAPIYMGDILYDSRGNAFEVAGVEMFRIFRDTNDPFETPVALLFKNLEGKSAVGNILINESLSINYLFCNHPLYQKRPDEDYETEYIAAQENGNSVALFSYEDMENGKLSLYGDDIKGLTIYRGWMMSPNMYNKFYQQCADQDIFLINDSGQYDECHLLPHWYDKIYPNTAKSVWTDDNNIEKAIPLLSEFDAGVIVKDYVKSRKHEWYEACYIPRSKDIGNAEKIIKTFTERQGENIIGGIVLREFLNLKQAGYHKQSGMPISEEYRVVIALKTIISVQAYWENQIQTELGRVGEFALEVTKDISSNFYTVDVAVMEDGTLVVMEIGDGQVSGLQEESAENYYRNINKILKISVNADKD